jgi:hypothetical protein
MLAILLLQHKMPLPHQKTNIFNPFLRLLTSIAGRVMGRQSVAVIISDAVLGLAAVFLQYLGINHLGAEVAVSNMYL